MSYLPFWLGAPALALPTYLFFRWLGRPMGVSGSLARLSRPRRSREDDRIADAMDDEEELERALREATLAEFGDLAATIAPEPVATSRPRSSPLRLPQNAAFVGGIFAGALLVAVLTHRFHPSLALPAAFASFGAPRALAALFGGGLLVGFGVRLSGGCTSGHGLSGCARLAAPSVVATLVFLGVAILTVKIVGSFG